MRIQLTKEEILKYEECYLEQSSNQAGLTNRVADERIEEALVAAGNRGHMILTDLEATARWKSSRTMSRIRKNTPDELTEISRTSFAAKTDRLRVGSLRCLSGVDWPMASVILHFVFSDEYPIVDERVLRAIGCTYKKDNLNFDRWMELTNFCRAECVRFGVRMRVLDRALWTYDKQGG